jgi:hypothetical protein
MQTWYNIQTSIHNYYDLSFEVYGNSDALSSRLLKDSISGKADLCEDEDREGDVDEDVDSNIEPDMDDVTSSCAGSLVMI